jgi:cytochrome P450 family 4 subfamily V
MLTPSFHFTILEQFTGVFNRNGDILIRRLSSHVDGPQFDITSYITMCTLDVVCGKLLSCCLYAIWRTLSYTTRALGCIIELLCDQLAPVTSPSFAYCTLFSDPT